MLRSTHGKKKSQKCSWYDACHNETEMTRWWNCHGNWNDDLTKKIVVGQTEVGEILIERFDYRQTTHVKLKKYNE